MVELADITYISIFHRVNPRFPGVPQEHGED